MLSALKASFLPQIHYAKLQPIAPILIRRVSSKQTFNRQRDLALIHSIRKYLDEKIQAPLIDYVQKALERHLPQSNAPHKAYERVVSFLIDKRKFVEATAVYETMVEQGYVSSNVIDAKMLALSLCTSSDDIRPIIDTLEAIFSAPTYSEKHALELLHILMDLEASPAAMVAVIDRFSKAKGEGYLPGVHWVAQAVGARARMGDIEKAIEHVAHYEKTKTSPTRSIYPYVSILSGISESRSWDAETAHEVVKLMHSNGITPRIAVFNALIKLQVRRRDLQAAFGIYATLKNGSSKLQIYPDDFTFASLFTVLSKLYQPDATNSQKRQYRHPGNVTKPRQLFHEMVDAIPNKPHLKLTTNLLNCALRTFILKRDYTGAYVAIRAFNTYFIDVNVKTFAIVVRHIASRLRKDILEYRRLEDSRWGDRFLGSTDHWDLKMDVGKDLERRLLSWASPQYFDVNPPGRIPISEAEQIYPVYLTPDPKELLEPEYMWEKKKLESIPLERLLRRAIYADLATSDSRTVSKAIVATRKEMTN